MQDEQSTFVHTSNPAKNIYVGQSVRIRVIGVKLSAETVIGTIRGDYLGVPPWP